MFRIGVVLLIGAFSFPANAAEVGNLDDLLVQLEEFGKEHNRMNVPREHGRFLQLMTELTHAQRVLEIGTSNGYSSIWIAKGLRATGGKLTTIEFDQERGNEAKENFKKAGLEDVVTLHIDDAFKVIPQLEEKYDLIFLDAWKPDYKKFFDIAFPKLNPGGVFLAHNAITSADKMRDFLDTVENHEELITSIVQMGGDGFSVSFRKRKPNTEEETEKQPGQ